MGGWFYLSVVDYMEADLNVSLIVRKRQSLSGQNDWRRPVYVTREKYVISPEDQVMIFFKICGINWTKVEKHLISQNVYLNVC